MTRKNIGQTPYSASARGTSCGRPRSPRAGNKQIIRPRYQQFKIKKLIPQSRQIQVK